MAYKRMSLALMAVLLVPLAWPHIFFKGQVPMDGNVLRLLYPNRSFLLAHPLTRWHWPLWNSYRNMGEPFLADPVSMAAYPLVWFLGWTRSILNFFGWWVAFHTLLSGFFMARWVYHHTQDEEAAFAGALVVMFNGFFMARLTLAHHFAAASYFPVVLYYFDTGQTLFLAVAMALQWLSGFPSFCYITALTLLSWSVFADHSKISLLLKSGSMAFGLAAFQLFPFLELIGHSARGVFLTPQSVIEYSESLRQLFKMVCIPQWFAWHPQLTGDQAVVSFYVGPVVLAVMSWATWKGQKRERAFFGAVMIGWILSLGGHLPGYSQIALLRVFRYPANWLILSVTGIAFLCGAGVAQLRKRQWKWWVIGCLLIDLLAFAQYTRVPWFTPDYLAVPPPLAQSIESLPLSRIYHSPLYMENLMAQSLRQSIHFMTLKEFLPPSYGMAFGVREVSSYQVLTLARTERFQNRLALEGPSSPLLRWAGVSTIVTLKPGAGSLEEQSPIIFKARDFNPPLFIAEEAVANKIVLKTYTSGLMRAVVFVDKPSTLVFSEVNYPGWEARIDENPVPLGLFENMFQSVQMPSGAHWVQFRYRPLSFRIGGITTCFTMLAVLGFFVRQRVSRTDGKSLAR